MSPTVTSDQPADLEIRILPRREDGYPVEFTLKGEQQYSGLVPSDLQSWKPSGEILVDGQELLRLLLDNPVLQQAWAEIRGQSPRRRIRLRIDRDAPELHGLPWELLVEDRVVLSAGSNSPFSRYLPVAMPWGGLVEDRPIRVLVAIASPDDIEAQYSLAALDVAAERAALEAAFADAGPDNLEATFLESPLTLEQLEEALRDGYQVLHYLGHGSYSPRRQQATLYLQDDAGHTKMVTDDELVAMLARQSEPPQLVFLSACQSAVRATADAFRGLGPKLVALGVPAVVAMQDFVALETARKLSGIFYRRLAEHGEVDTALNEARGTLLTAGHADAAIPVLFMRLKSGQLWSAEADARGTVLGSQKPEVFWSGLVRMIQQQKCIPVIGPRVHNRWLPTPQELALLWSEEHSYPFASKDELPRVAQYLASSQGADFPRYESLSALKRWLADRLPEELQEQLCEQLMQQLRLRKKPDKIADLFANDSVTLSAVLKALGWSTLTADDPNEPHRVLASLNLPLYFTTNIDSFMVEALAAAGKTPTRELCRWNQAQPTSVFDDANYVPDVDNPLVYHLFGSDEEPDSLVLTDDNYLDYLVSVPPPQMKRIPDYIRGAIASNALLFVGYSLSDLEFRVIMRGLVATMDQRKRFKHVAVQLAFEDAAHSDVAAVQSFLQQYFQDSEINVFWGTSQQFVAELRSVWERRK